MEKNTSKVMERNTSVKTKKKNIDLFIKTFYPTDK